jgi:hypothetical protein
MWLTNDYKELGKIEDSIIAPVTRIFEGNNWQGKEYDRFEPDLIGGKLIVFPYIIIQPKQLQYTAVQLNLLQAIEPIVEEVMKIFPKHVKIRGEVATLLPGVKIKPHYDDRWFHEHCRRIHVPIVTNEKCLHVFENRFAKLEYSKIYEINNRILHSAVNSGTTNRVHLILDLLDETLYHSIGCSASKLVEISIPEKFKNTQTIPK